jgi:hypothetical protein
VFPNYATYANSLIGSDYRLSKIVVDSNVDWGQDVPLLAKTLKKMGIDNINYALFGHNPPEVWGIEHYRWILPDYPFATNMPEAVPPDWSIPSAVSLHNLTRVRDLYPGKFDREPDYILHSILLFMPEAQTARTD